MTSQAIDISKERAADPIEVVPETPRLDARVDLRQMFPQSIRLPFAESFLHLIGLALVTAGYISLATRLPPATGSPNIVDGTEFILRCIFYIAVCIGGGKLIYELLCYLVYRYSIELEHLTITRGILFRTRASVPIAKINDVSLSRGPVEILFGLYNLTILTASPTANHGTIEGLPSKSAHGLQAYLLALVETTLPNVQDRVAENLIERASTGGYRAESNPSATDPQ